MKHNNNHIFFDKKDLNSDLKTHSLRSGAITLTSQGLMFFLKISSTMILARILSPKDYGIIAMVTAITGMAGIFINLGLSTATIQRVEINHTQISTLFWINSGIGLSIMLLVSCLSPGISSFYKSPEVTWVTLALSSNFLINGLAVQHLALLNRQMRFFAISVIQVSSMIIGTVVAIVVAIQGYGYWALVLSSITISGCNTIGAWIASGWVPERPQYNSEVLGMIKYGSDIMGFNIINYFARNLDNILIGRFHGSGALGFYTKAYQLLMMPITNLRDPLNKVAMPSLSRLQNKPEQYRNYYMKFVAIIAFTSMPVIVFMSVCSDNIISIILGAQWTGVSEIFQILAFAGLIQTVTSTRGLVLLSMGKSRKYLWWGSANAVVTIISFLIGLPWGAKGVATSYAIANYLLLYPSLFYVFKDTPVHVNDFFIAIYKPLISGLTMGLACYFLLPKLNGLSDVAVLLICMVMSIGIYFLTLTVISGGLKEIREYYSYCCLVFTKKINL